HWSTS
ncbi:pyruvate formate lyase family protein, partial [Vibrio parahaemolyticus V-223/04]